MSLAVKRGKVRGDPGLWSGLVQAGRAFLGGGGITGAASAFGQEMGWAQPGVTFPQIAINPPFGGAPGAGYGIQIGGERGLRFEAGVGETAEAVQMALNGAAVNGDRRAPSGYHWNKTGYFVKGTPASPPPYRGQGPQYIAPGTVLVKNRRRNPANMRAADRSIGRIKAAKRLTKSLGRVTIREKCKHNA